MTKTIIVPIDFSDASKNALETAVHLARKFDSRILLHHTLAPSFSFNDDISNVNEVTAKRLLDDLAKDMCNGLDVHSQIAVGSDLLYNLENLTKRNEGSLVVMGTTGASGAKRLFMGSNAVKVVNNLMSPVLVVPEDSDLQSFTTILYAADYKEVDNDNGLDYLKEFAVANSCEVKVLHIQKSHKELSYEEIMEQKREHHFLESVPHSFRYVKSSNPVRGIEGYLKRHPGVDVLCLLKRDKSFLKSIMEDSVTDTLLFRNKIPILVLRDTKLN